MVVPSQSVFSAASTVMRRERKRKLLTHISKQGWYNLRTLEIINAANAYCYSLEGGGGDLQQAH